MSCDGPRFDPERSNRDGSASANTDLFRRRALRLGEECRVIAPVELAEEVRAAAAAALALYD